MKNLLLVMSLLSLLIASSPAIALRCGNKIITVGDRMHKVQRVCGHPTYVYSYNQPIWFYGYAYGYDHIDVWTYNFGPRRFMQELIFQNGILRYINRLEYGY